MLSKRTMRPLLDDKLALAAVVFLVVVFLTAAFGSLLVKDTPMNLRARHLPPFRLEHGWLYLLGADSLGRSVLGRLILASRNSVGIALSTVVFALSIGGAIGLYAGLKTGWVSNLIMRAVDVLMSIPSLLLAIVVLYALGAHPANVILVLSVTRLPIFIRTARAEALEIRERGFVAAGRVMGASDFHLLTRHIAPVALPMLLALAALEFAYVMLAESALTFLGIGIQPPEVSWGLMVSEGRSYLGQAWWVSFWPGAAIALVALASIIVGNWFRIANDPTLRARSRGVVASHA